VASYGGGGGDWEEMMMITTTSSTLAMTTQSSTEEKLELGLDPHLYLLCIHRGKAGGVSTVLLKDHRQNSHRKGDEQVPHLVYGF
jgi:hypothetical protein